MLRQKTDFLLQIHVHPDINNITVNLKVMIVLSWRLWRAGRWWPMGEIAAVLRDPVLV